MDYLETLDIRRVTEMKDNSRISLEYILNEYRNVGKHMYVPFPSERDAVECDILVQNCNKYLENSQNHKNYNYICMVDYIKRDAEKTVDMYVEQNYMYGRCT